MMSATCVPPHPVRPSQPANWLGLRLQGAQCYFTRHWVGFQNGIIQDINCRVLNAEALENTPLLLRLCDMWIMGVGALFPSLHNDNHNVPLLHAEHISTIPFIFKIIFQKIRYTKGTKWTRRSMLQCLNGGRITRRRCKSGRSALIPLLKRRQRLDIDIETTERWTHHFVWVSKRRRRGRKCEEKDGRCFCVASCTQRGRCNNCWMGRAALLVLYARGDGHLLLCGWRTVEKKILNAHLLWLIVSNPTSSILKGRWWKCIWFLIIYQLMLLVTYLIYRALRTKRM